MNAAPKYDGMQLALFAKPEWAERAKAAISQLAATKANFTAEDVIERVGMPTRHRGANGNNAVGAIVSAAARRKEIVRVGFVEAKRSESHGRIISVWVGR